MAGTLLYQNRRIGMSAYSPYYIDDGGYTIIPCVFSDSSMSEPEHERKCVRARPTGETGSGPYFVSYKTSGQGYDTYWYNGNAKTRYVTTLDVVRESAYGFRGHFFSDGEVAYSCGVGSGADAGYSFWNYVKRNSDGSYVHSAMRPRYGPRASSMEEAEEQMFAAQKLQYDASRLYKANNCLWTQLPVPDTFNWKLGEQDAFWWHDLTGVLPRGYQIAATQSYIEAANSIPQASSNSIANVLQAAGSVLDILHGDISPKHIKDVWLKYRYEYCTTKMDVEEYANLTRRLMALANASTIRCSGSFAYQGVSCVTSFDVDSNAWMPSDTKSWLRAYGFKFSVVNAWDMVPYSFIVDWFLHISDLLEALQKQDNAISLQVSDCWHVFQTEYDQQFTMFRVPKAIKFGVPYVSYSPASAKTIGKRITDAIALFLC